MIKAYTNLFKAIKEHIEYEISIRPENEYQKEIEFKHGVEFGKQTVYNGV